MSDGKTVAGVDGCKNGWAVVEINLSTGAVSARVIECARELLAVSEPGLIVVDIPIGFPERAEQGGRACEREARKKLGSGGSRVFPSPARAALLASNYPQARQINREHHIDRKGISKQCFCLFPKMREVDALMPNPRIVECHPELCFWAMNGGKAVAEGKNTDAGFKIRKGILMRNGFCESFLQQSPPRKGKIVSGRDDLLDACAAAWTARRIAENTAECIPKGGGEKDAKGIKMEMWY